MRVEKEKILPGGIFISQVKIAGKKFRSMTYIGSRPTIGSTVKTAEVYVIGFGGRLYGKKIKVELLSKIRNDKKFSSIVSLALQIEKDLKITRKYFNGHRKVIDISLHCM